MKSRIKLILKNIRVVYFIYACLGSLLVNVLKPFITTDDKLILFVAYGGKRYDDSPKAIFEYMYNSGKYADFRYVWAFDNPAQYNIHGAEKVKIDTLSYFITVLKARYWITNSSVKRGLNFTKRNVFYLNTWHGTPLKKLGKHLTSNKVFKSVGTPFDIDLMLAQSEYEVEIFSEAFGISKDRFLISGLPRNDELVSASVSDRLKARANLGLDNQKIVILYAPTFREYDKDREMRCFINPPIDLKKWRSRLGSDYVFMLRTHYEIAKVYMAADVGDFVLDVSNHPSINELMIASDILISDYSSIFFDYSLLKKPMICFAYDIQKYTAERGLYIDPNEEVPGGVITTEDEVISAILSMDYFFAGERTGEFCQKYIAKSGDACQAVASTIFGS